MRLLRVAATASVTVVALAAGAVTGCVDAKSNPAPAAATGGSSAAGPADEVAAARAKLSPEDRALIDAQEWCVVQTDERLGSMGVPLKIDIKGQPVFICCKGCQKKAEKDPDATLTKLEELKVKAKAAKAGAAK